MNIYLKEKPKEENYARSLKNVTPFNYYWEEEKQKQIGNWTQSNERCFPYFNQF